MMNGKIILVLSLFLVGLSSAYLPSCQTPTYSVLGSTFILSSQNQSVACNASTRDWYGFEANPAAAGTIASAYTHNASHMKIGASNAYIYVRLPAENNYTMHYIGGSQVVRCAESPSISISGGWVRMYDINTTTYQLVSSTGATTNCSRSSRIEFYCDATPCVSFPYYNSSTSYESQVTSQLNVPSNYYSYFQPSNTILRSNITSNTMYYTNSNLTDFCRALLYFNNPYYGNIQLIPLITYYGNNAFGRFYNTSDNTAYIPNSTISYVYDSVTSIWYIVPAQTCANYNPLTVATLQYNPTGVTSGTLGEIPIEQGSLSGSCSMNSATNVVTCTLADSSSSLTILNVTGYQAANSSVICANGTTGSSATLGCSLPNVNSTYTVYAYGQDANGFYHVITAKQFTVGVLPGVSSYGRDGFIAAMMLVIMTAFISTGSIAISMVLAVAGIFVIGLMGIIPVGQAVVVGILFGAVALMLAYRLRV